MTQKIIKIGSSAGLILSKQTLQSLKLKIGDKLRVRADDKNRKLILEADVFQPKISREEKEWTEQFVERYRQALEALRDK